MAADKYMKKYSKYIYEAPESKMQRITGKDLEDAAMHVKNTAGGMDMWTPADFKFLSRGAFDELAVMLNMVEEGAE